MAHRYRLLPPEETKGALPGWRAGSCLCGQRGPAATPERAKQIGEDWFIGHRAEVEVRRARIRGGTPSLASQRNYFEEQAAREDLPDAEREQWQALAEEITARLNDRDIPQLEELPLSWD